MAENKNTNEYNSTSELQIRREKLAALTDAGKNPFEITKYEATHTAKCAISEFESREQRSKRARK